MSILRESIIEEYISKNYPSAKIRNYNDPDTDLKFYSAEELKSVDEDWFPLACYKDETGKAIYGGRKKVYHTYVEGETGAGKTTRFVMQSILALSSMKNKPSFVIVDIHGEIIENLYNHLKNSGYKIKILNCDDPQRSDTYNPFSELAEECAKTKEISNDTINKLRRIAEIIQPVESTDDPIWDQGARSYTNGCILDKFEDLIKGDLPKECLTLYNVLQNHYWLRETITQSQFGQTDLFKIPHYKKKGSKALSTQKMIAVTNNAEKTRASYFGVVENHYDAFGQPSLYSLSSSNTIDISDFIEEPTVIVIQSGSTKIGDDLISLLVNEIYTYVVKKGKESKRKKLPRNIHCFLDEFANCNIADGPEYAKMLTTSRKFGMFWHMILQCDAQLDRKYDSNIGRIIRANSTEIFMGSHDYETEVRFARSCGQKTIESLSSEIVQQDPRLEIVDLMTPEKLNLIEEGCAYIKTNRHPLTKTYIEAFYKCDEFIPVDDIDEVYPYNTFDYHQTAFFPDDIPPVLTKEEYEVIKYLKDGKKTFLELQDKFPEIEMRTLLRELSQKKAVDLLPQRSIASNITKRQYALYEYRERNGFDNVYGEATPSESQSLSKAASMPKAQRSPFDFDFDDDEDETESASEYFEKWDSDEKSNSLYIELEEFSNSIDIKALKAKLEKITCVPYCLIDALDYINTPEHERKEFPEFPENDKILKFEIIEEFIKENDFKTKKGWTDAIKREVELLKKDRMLPPTWIIAFENAVTEIDRELTLTNIFEIKRIISG